MQRIIPENPGMDHAQLAPNTHPLSSPGGDCHDSYDSRNFILLTPIRIRLQKATLSNNPKSPQQHSPPNYPSTSPFPNQSPREGQLTLGPNPVSPKTANNPSKSYSMNHFDQTSLIHLNQSPLTTFKKKIPTATQHQKATKLHPPLSEPQATNQKRKVPRTEVESFTKRLRNAVEEAEPVYFDPITVSFIPRSKLESFIWRKERSLKTMVSSNLTLISYLFLWYLILPSLL